MLLNSDQILVNRYRIIRLLGTGGMAAVYYAHDPVLDRAVAIKQLLPDPITDEPANALIREQFQREARILATLHHPNLPRVTDYFEHDGYPYLVMDYIEGQTLSEIVTEKGHGLDEELVLNWAAQLLSALDYIHQHGIVHRDVKPANIRRTSTGQIFLVDFGLFKALNPANPQTAAIMRGMGTAEYAPPEQYDLEDGHTDPRSDLYSLGATLYHLLSGQAPVTVTKRMADPEAFQPIRAHTANISPEVEQVILRAMEMQRAQRFASAADMRDALRLARHQPIEPGATSRLPIEPTPQSIRHPSTRPFGIMILLAVLIVSIAGLVILAGSATPAPTPTVISRPDVRLTLLSGTTTPEYILLQNSGTISQDLSGWYVVSAIGSQTFRFPAGYVLAPGASVRLESYKGAVNKPPEILLWSTDAIWRNEGDKVILYNNSNTVINSLCYGDACP